MGLAEVSIIIAVYNKPDFLIKIFESLKNQSFFDFEVIIADDGSGPEIKETVEQYQNVFKYPIRHVWHEDKGFRKTLIANQAVKQTNTDYIVFIDGDCILHHRFVERHFKLRKMRTVLTGRRVSLDREFSDRVTNNDIRTKSIQKISFWKNHCDKGDMRRGRYLSGLFFLENLFRWKYRLMGCNFSVHTSDFLSVNGYDERIIGRGLEDANLEARFRVKGLKIKSITRQALQYHLFHYADPMPHSREMIDEFCHVKSYWTEHGIIKGKPDEDVIKNFVA
jgi:glycosyltransferase involved in cell wall biosynthesis